jgi:glycosyltransferase involved in cell wall biosynthesis
VRAHREELHLAPEWMDRLTRSMGELGMIGKGATVIGYLRTESGVGELGRATCRALTAVAYPIATVVLEDASKRQADLSVRDREPRGPLPFTLLHANAPEAAKMQDMLKPWLEGRFVIGYWAWELETTPADWVRTFPLFDEVWTCSRFAAAALGAVSPVPVQTVWPALSDETPAPVSRPALGLDPGAFTFLFMYDMFSETDRKNPLGLIQAFREAFRRDDKVQLAIKLSNSNHRREDLARVVAAAEGLPVRFLDRYLLRAEVLGLIEASDAYVSLHRAEGFGFTLAESMALAKPVIATYYSGNVDFMTPWNSFPVPYRMGQVPDDRGPYRKGSPWAEPDVGRAAALMREVFEKPDLAREVARRGQSDVLRLLSPRACGRRIADRLGVLASCGVRHRELEDGEDEAHS